MRINFFAALILVLTPLLHDGLVSYGDTSWHLRWMQAFYEALAQAQWWPIWLSDADFGLGAPLFGFYAPGSFWLAAVLQAIGLPILAAYKCVLGLGLALLISAGWRANPRFGAWAMLLPAVFLGYWWNAPAGALGAGFAALAWVMWNEKRLRLGAALAFACIACHLLSGLMLLVLLGFHCLLEAKDWRARGMNLAQLLAILAASAMFWLPGMLLKTQIDSAYLLEHKSYQIACNLFFWQVENCGAFRAERLWLNAVQAVLLLWFAIICKRAWQIKTQRTLLYCCAIVLLLTTVLALPIYALVKPLAMIQFGWRWWPLLVLLLIQLTPAEHIRTGFMASAALLGLSLLLYPGWQFGVLPERGWASPTVLASVAARHQIALPEYRPNRIERAQMASFVERQRIEPALRSAALLRFEILRRTHHEAIYTLQQSHAGQVDIKQFCFPGWQVQINDQPQTLSCDARVHTMQVLAPAGESRLRLRYQWSWHYWLGWAASGIGILLLGWLLKRSVQLQQASA